tara:strand:- start:6040 stop:6462 length:423 start_codon:yes stop_codon:yes gene_type:complete
MLRIFKSKLTEEEFGRKYFGKLEEKVPGLKFISLDGLELKTKLEGHDEMRHLLDNSFAEYKNDPKDLNKIIEKYSNASKELFDSKSAIEPKRIVPIIKDYRFLDETLKLNPDFKNDFLFKNIMKNSISFMQRIKNQQLDI